MSSCQGNFLQEPRMVNGLLLELLWSPEAQLNDCPKHNHSLLGTIQICHRPSVANGPHRSQNTPLVLPIRWEFKQVVWGESSKVNEQIPSFKILHRIFHGPKC